MKRATFAAVVSAACLVANFAEAHESFLLEDSVTGEINGPFIVAQDSTLELDGRTYTMRLVDAPTPDTSSPSSALTGYLRAGNWIERIPYVFKREGTVERMASAYFTAPEFGIERITILGAGENYDGDEETTIFFASTNQFNVRYVLRQVGDDWFVDWEGSRDLLARDEAMATQRDALSSLAGADVERPVISITSLDIVAGSINQNAVISLRNESSVHIESLSLSLAFSGEDGRLLGEQSGFIQNISPGETAVRSINTQIRDGHTIAEVTPRLQRLSISGPGSGDAARFFSLQLPEGVAPKVSR